MKLSAAQRGAVRDIEAICSREADSRTLRRRVAERLSRLVYWDAVCFGTIDPWTMLVTDDLSYGVPPHGYARAAHNEYFVDDLHKIAALARSATRVGILSQAPREQQEASHRVRTILPTIDARYEARVACVADGQCWGVISMFRNGDKDDFSSADAALLHAVSAPLAAGLRRAACRPDASAGVTVGKAGPGVLILGPRNETLAANDAARYWLDELTPAQLQRHGELPYAVHQVAARAQAHIADPDRSGRAPDAYARVRSRAGRWVTVHAAPVDGGLIAGTGTSVVLEAAPASDIMEMLMSAYGLTRREREVLERVIAGTPSSAVAAQLCISVNTVQDHLKSIFAKVGVRRRGQLVAHLLEEHYLPSAGTQ